MAIKSFVFRFDDVEAREREFSIIKGGEVLAVEPKAFRVLLFLLRNPGKLIAKEELLNAVWGDAAVTDNSLVRSVALLRRLLGDETRSPRYIETVATVGYRLVCKVEVSEEASGILEVAGEANGNAQAAEANAQSRIDTGVVKKAKGERQMVGGRKKLVGGIPAVAGLLIAGLAAAIWYLHRPLPPPHITEYVQITTDGRPKILAGTDGSRLYFTVMPSTSLSPHSLAEVAATGGEIAQIQIAIPDGKFLAVDVSREGSSALIAAVEKGNPPFEFWIASFVGGLIAPPSWERPRGGLFPGWQIRGLHDSGRRTLGHGDRRERGAQSGFGRGRGGSYADLVPGWERDPISERYPNLGDCLEWIESSPTASRLA